MTARERRTLTLMTQAAIDWEQSYIDSLRGTKDKPERTKRERLIRNYTELRVKLERQADTIDTLKARVVELAGSGELACLGVK